MGSSNNIKINKANTLLNIYILNSEKQVQKMRFLEEIENGEQNDYKVYNHKFYGWTFYDYGKELNDNIIEKARNKIINEAKNDNFKNVVLYFVSNKDNNFDLKLLESIAEIVKQDETNSEYFQPLILYVTNSEEKTLEYYRKKASELNKDSEKYEIDELNISSFIYNERTFVKNWLMNYGK